MTTTPAPSTVVSLVTNYGRLIHKSSCPAALRSRGLHGIHPAIEESEVPAFLKARRLEPCLSCFPKLRKVAE